VSQPKKLYSYLYGALRPVVLLAVRIFYRRFDIEGIENVPKDRAVIFVANHQNALMDPLLCCVTAPEQIGFLARADVFKNPKIAKVLFYLHMLPVYRAHDKVEDQRAQNAKIFEKCYAKLRRGNAIALFPEGNHNNQRKLRPLRKGVARIALGSQADGAFPLSIVPVGIHYANFDKFRSDVLVMYGKPMDVSDILEEHGGDNPKAQLAMLNTIREGISNYMIDLNNGGQTATADQLAAVLFANASNGMPRKITTDLQFGLFKSIERMVNDSATADVWEPLHKKWHTHAKTWRAWILGREVYGKFPILGWLMVMIFGAPIAALGALLNCVPYLIVDQLTPHLIEDEQFVSSIKLLLGLILFPVSWVLMAWGATHWLGAYGWLIIIAALPLGIFAMNYVKRGEYLKRSLKWLSFKRKHKEEAQVVVDDFTALSEHLYNNYVSA